VEAPEVCGTQEPLLPEPQRVEGRATQGQGTFKAQERRHPGLHKTARLRGLNACAEISKWFAYSVSFLVSSLGLGLLNTEVLHNRAIEYAAGISGIVAVVAVPTAIGVAILRYRLYEIDIIINRTLVYGSLTATLVALYFGGIVVLQRVFVLLTAQQSTLAVVASTLAIAALFNPLRRRIQGFVDRSFYRSKYDARKTLESFSAKLRDETDLEALNKDLVGVVRETMAPAHVSLWLRTDSASRGKGSGESVRRSPA
jgi:hypothetical protein